MCSRAIAVKSTQYFIRFALRIARSSSAVLAPMRPSATPRDGAVATAAPVVAAPAALAVLAEEARAATETGRDSEAETAGRARAEKSEGAPARDAAVVAMGRSAEASGDAAALPAEAAAPSFAAAPAAAVVVRASMERRGFETEAEERDSMAVSAVRISKVPLGGSGLCLSTATGKGRESRD